jgi:hypothetical protein
LTLAQPFAAPSLPSNLHLRIHGLVHRCLEKEPKRQWHAAGDVRVEIAASSTNSLMVVVNWPRLMKQR